MQRCLKQRQQSIELMQVRQAKPDEEHHQLSAKRKRLLLCSFDVIYTLPFKCTGAHIVRLEEALLAHTSGGGTGAQNIAALLTAQTTSQEAVINECNAAALMLVSRLMHRLLLQPCQVCNLDNAIQTEITTGCQVSFFAQTWLLPIPARQRVSVLALPAQPASTSSLGTPKEGRLAGAALSSMYFSAAACRPHICTITTTRSIELFVHEGANPA